MKLHQIYMCVNGELSISEDCIFSLILILHLTVSERSSEENYSLFPWDLQEQTQVYNSILLKAKR